MLSAFGLFTLSGAAMATNGYFTHGVGTESKGMAGAGVQFSGTFGGGDAGVDLSQAFLATNYAGKADDNFAFDWDDMTTYKIGLDRQIELKMKQVEFEVSYIW